MFINYSLPNIYIIILLIIIYTILLRSVMLFTLYKNTRKIKKYLLLI